MWVLLSFNQDLVLYLIQKLMVLNTESSWKQFKACHAIVLVGELYLLAFDLCWRATLFTGLLDPKSVILKNTVPVFRSGWDL